MSGKEYKRSLPTSHQTKTLQSGKQNGQGGGNQPSGTSDKNSGSQGGEKHSGDKS